MRRRRRTPPRARPAATCRRSRTRRAGRSRAAAASARGGVRGRVEQRGGRDRRADPAADGGRVPAAVVERRMARAGERAHRLEPARVGGEHVADGRAGRGADRDRRGRDRRAEVGDARQVGVVEVEHVPGGAERDDPLEQAVAGRRRRARRRLGAPAHRARHPVEQRRAVGREVSRHAQRRARRPRREPEGVGDQLVGAAAGAVVAGDRDHDHLLGAVAGGHLLDPGAHGRRASPMHARRPAAGSLACSASRKRSAFSGGGTGISRPRRSSVKRHAARSPPAAAPPRRSSAQIAQTATATRGVASRSDGWKSLAVQRRGSSAPSGLMKSANA